MIYRTSTLIVNRTCVKVALEAPQEILSAKRRYKRSGDGKSIVGHCQYRSKSSPGGDDRALGLPDKGHGNEDDSVRSGTVSASTVVLAILNEQQLHLSPASIQFSEN